MIKNFVYIVALIFLLNITCLSQEYSRVQGWAEQGGYDVRTSGVTTHEVQRSYPNSTVTVYLAGTVTLATIYTNSSGTAKANPFTADATAYWFFYVANGKYDIRFSGFGVTTPFTIPDVIVTGTGSGGVISVGLSAPMQFLVSNSPITSSGTISLSWVSQLSNTFFAAPCNGNGIPGFRKICDNDLTDVNVVTNISAGTGILLTPNPIVKTGTVAIADQPVTPGPYTNPNLTVNQQGQITSISNGSGAGTVTSITAGTGLTASPSNPITTSGTLSITNTGVTAGTYNNNLSLTVNAQGQLTSVSNGNLPYDIAIQVDGEPTASAVVLRFVAVRSFNLPSNFTGTRCSSAIAATAQTDLVVAVNGVSKGTLRFAASGTTCSIVSGTATALVAGDVLTITAPASPDATLGDFTITLLGSI
jgi:hypothetical protein